MKVFDLWQLLNPELVPERVKIHLPSDNGKENPLELYRHDTFYEWQPWQSKRNFERPIVVSFIQMPEPERWLFAGAFSSHGCRPDGTGFLYELEQRATCRELEGRLVARFA